MPYSLDTLSAAMIAYDAGDAKRIHHFLKVHALARLIGVGEQLDEAVQFTLETAALVHDIGIHRAEALYGHSTGKYQEELGPAEADTLLRGLGWPPAVIDRVLYLVGHHHTYQNIDSLDYQILVEADFLVNLYEDQASEDVQKQIYTTIFQTETGKRLCRELYPAAGR